MALLILSHISGLYIVSTLKTQIQRHKTIVEYLKPSYAYLKLYIKIKGIGSKALHLWFCNEVNKYVINNRIFVLYILR